MGKLIKEKSIFGWNKDSMSWSAYFSWVGSKESYRKKYYVENRVDFSTLETAFGNKIGKLLENNHPSLAHIKKYSHPEYKIEVEIGGYKFIGYIDSFDLKTKSILEYKTSHKNKKGEHQWNHVKVSQHQQLDLYSLMVQKKFGKVKNLCELIYMETKFNDKKLTYKGRTFQKRKALKLVGKPKTFKRTILQWERDAMEKRILKVANEIKEDYARLQKNGRNKTPKKPSDKGPLPRDAEKVSRSKTPKKI